MFELALYGHLLVGTFVLFGTHFRRISASVKQCMLKKGYCTEKKGRRFNKSKSESDLIGIRLSNTDILIEDEGRGK